MLDCILHVLKITQSLVFFAGICPDGHTVQLTETSCFIEMKKNTADVSSHTDKMCAADLERVGYEQALAAPEKNIDVLEC